MKNQIVYMTFLLFFLVGCENMKSEEKIEYFDLNDSKTTEQLLKMRPTFRLVEEDLINLPPLTMHANGVALGPLKQFAPGSETNLCKIEYDGQGTWNYGNNAIKVKIDRVIDMTTCEIRHLEFEIRNVRCRIEEKGKITVCHVSELVELENLGTKAELGIEFRDYKVIH